MVDNEISLMLKKEGKSKYFLGKKDKYKKYSREEKDVICFECKKPSHIKVEYTKLRKKVESKEIEESNGKSSHWFLDSGCSCHMTRDMFMFLDLKPHKGTISFGARERLVNILHLPLIMFYRYVISFNKDACIIKRNDDNILFIAKRHDNLYRFNLEDLSNQKVTCLILLELLHLDLFGPIRTPSLEGKKYGFVIIGDYFRFTWVYFPSHKHESYEFKTFYEKNGIFHNFSSLKTPQQNGVVERKNRTLQEMVRTMRYENFLPKHFWAKDQLEIFVGYSYTSKAYSVYNSRILIVEEFINVEFNNGLTSNKILLNLEEYFIGSSNKATYAARTLYTPKLSNTKAELDQQTITMDGQPPRDWKFVTYHPQDPILGDRVEGIKPKNIDETLKDNDWTIAMEDELH
ncbi:hypothetical protein CR513_48289, partial [Mucuna pruriens]